MKKKDCEKTSRRCQECGAPLSGRKDKKFCSLECKNIYNNRMLRYRKAVRENVLSQLSRNYNILDSLISDKKTSVKMDELKRLGFDSSCITGYINDSSCHECCSCFDIAYYRTAGKIFNIRRSEDATKSL